MNITALENCLEYFENSIVEHIKKFGVIPSTIQTSTEISENPKIPAGAKMENTQDKTKVLVKNMYEEEKEKINQEAVREEEKVIQDMHSRGMLGSSIHINGLEEVQVNPKFRTNWD
ncbi:MAG: hypothetical protein COT45_03000 [bacterium (Candidatus Stahlbacteria) CG08_land_8_20_14_0_20_40_26]|nr:MAG: hypothetical protein COT45_03000 [bacterium (Candidatus Stahlbacteria) CG08_land_8_20_14_0_20_40_26]